MQSLRPNGVPAQPDAVFPHRRVFGLKAEVPALRHPTLGRHDLDEARVEYEPGSTAEAMVPVDPGAIRPSRADEGSRGVGDRQVLQGVGGVPQLRAPSASWLSGQETEAWPFHGQLSPVTEGGPRGSDLVELPRGWGRVTLLPTEEVLSDDALGRGDALPIGGDHRSPWLRPSASRALERCPSGHRPPEPVSDVQHAFDDQLDEIMRQPAPTQGHRRARDAGPAATNGLPGADPIFNQLPERHLHGADGRRGCRTSPANSHLYCPGRRPPATPSEEIQGCGRIPTSRSAPAHRGVCPAPRGV